MTVRLADCAARQMHVSNPPSTVDGNMNELLALIARGDHAQLPALGQPTMNALQAPSLGHARPTANPGQLSPVTYTKVSAIAASLPLLRNRSNLNLKVKLISFGSLSMVGDESGVLSLKVHCPTMFHVLKKLKAGASIIIRKATVRLRGGFGQRDLINVDIDKGVGSIEESRDPFQFEPTTSLPKVHHNISAQSAPYHCIAHSIKPGDACCRPCCPDCFDNRCEHCNCNGNAFCGDAVQVAFDTMSESEDPVALTLGMTGVIVEICQNGDALVRFVGEHTNQLMKRNALPKLVFLETKYGDRVDPVDVSMLRDRDMRRPGWLMHEFSEKEAAAGEEGEGKGEE